MQISILSMSIAALFYIAFFILAYGLVCKLIQYKNIVGQVFTEKKIKCFLVYIKKNDALEVEMV